METMYKGTYLNGFIKLEPRKYIGLQESQKVLVIPLKRKKRRAAGILHKYADVSLLSKEKGAFENAMVQKHIQ